MIFLFEDRRQGDNYSEVERVGLQRLENLISEKGEPSSMPVGA